jgi:predicted small secreted protein
MNSKHLLLALVFAPATLGIAACNTVEGAGEDLQSASREVREGINN